MNDKKAEEMISEYRNDPVYVRKGKFYRSLNRCISLGLLQQATLLLDVYSDICDMLDEPKTPDGILKSLGNHLCYMDMAFENRIKGVTGVYY